MRTEQQVLHSTPSADGRYNFAFPSAEIDVNVFIIDFGDKNKSYTSCAICIAIRLAIAVSTALYISVSAVSIVTISE